MAPMAHYGALMMPDGADSRTDGAGVAPHGRSIILKAAKGSE